MKKGQSKVKRKVEILESFKYSINIEVENNKMYFEVINNNDVLHTYDVAEGVAAIMMNKHYIQEDIWNTQLTEKDKKEISSVKALYWLTGGNVEWIESTNYKVNWHEASIIFKKKFGSKITRIVRKANTLGDIVTKFKKEFNLTVLYEFAIKNDLIQNI